MDLREIAAIALDEAGFAEDVSLTEHDRRFHPGGFTEGQNCKFRRDLAHDDGPDKVVSWSLGRDTDGKPGGVSVAICDITDEDTDAIVNAANRWMLGGGGVDGAIHRAAGPKLLEECERYPADEHGYRVQTGDAKITGGGNLKAKFVIHTAGPDMRDRESAKDPENGGKLLRSSYRRSLEEAKKAGAKSVSFPSISTGIFGYPLEKAAQFAAEEITEFLAENPEMSVRMCIYDPWDSEKIAAAYTKAFQEAEGRKGQRSEAGGQTAEAEDEAPEVRNLRHLLRTNAISKKEFASSLAALAALGKVSKARIGLLKRQMFVEDAADPDEDASNGITRTDNGDGTVTYSMTIGFDPEVQAEMSKAMPKGQKREDQADVLDEAPKGVFALALDEAIAEDAGGSRHANTPLENCRAKDPMFCPYHGQKAIQKWVEDEIKKQFANPNSWASISVDVVQRGNAFEVNVKAPGSLTPQPISLALAALGKKNGVKLLKVHPWSAGGPTQLQQHGIEIDAKPDYDKVSMIEELGDEIQSDIESDPVLQATLSPDEMAEFFLARSAFSADPTNVKKRDDAFRKYESLRGQIVFKDADSLAKIGAHESAFSAQHTADMKDYHDKKAEVDAVKKVFWPNGRFPNGFAKANPFVDAYNKASQAVGYFADVAYTTAKTDYDSKIGATPTNPSPEALRALKGPLYALQRAKEKYAEANEQYAVAKTQFMKDFYDWAVKNQGNPNCPSAAQVQQAFPNGRPDSVQTQPAQPKPQQSTQQLTQQQPAGNQSQNSTPTSTTTKLTVLDRFKAMTLPQARSVLASFFTNVYDHKSNLPLRLNSNPRRRTFKECTKKESEDAIRYMAATCEDLKARFPNSMLATIKCDFTPALSGSVRGRCVYWSTGDRVISWKMRSAQDHSKEDAFMKSAMMKAIGSYTVSTRQPRDERDETTIYHEMAHIVYRFGNPGLVSKFTSACSSASAADPKWMDRVSRYANKNDNECHSECIALAMSRGYKKGTLPKEIERYVFEDILGMAAGTW